MHLDELEYRPPVEYPRYTRKHLKVMPYARMLLSWVDWYKEHPDTLKENQRWLKEAYRKMASRRWAPTAQHYGRLIGLHQQAWHVARKARGLTGMVDYRARGRDSIRPNS